AAPRSALVDFHSAISGFVLPSERLPRYGRAYLGMLTIADKINLVLAQRRMLKRDLARALGVAPQTATDICKGRSAVTLPHLRKLCELFQLRADYWLDDARLEPGPADRLQPGLERNLAGLAELGLLSLDDAAGF